MKIDLEYPYDKDWKNGYLVVNGENRKTVILFNSSKDRSSTAYARYLVSVALGRYLTDDEHVDHIDHDKTNDVLENLQILSKKDNNLKESKRRGRVLVEVICPYCAKHFTRRKGNTPLVKCKEGTIIFCSNECKIKYPYYNLSYDEKKKIFKDSVVRVFRYHGEE